MIMVLCTPYSVSLRPSDVLWIVKCPDGAIVEGTKDFMASEAPDYWNPPSLVLGASLFDFQGIPVAKKRVCHGASDLYAVSVPFLPTSAVTPGLEFIGSVCGKWRIPFAIAERSREPVQTG